jgi:NADH:ubiquinone oxidoreductase subunit 5 (subunit L)/multisubunit Na+/H+ antiporter MnhA subunit
MLMQLLTMLLIVPIIGFIGCILLPRKWERAIFGVAIATIAVEFVTFLLAGYQWLAEGAIPVLTSMGSLYASHSYGFNLDFFFDRFAAVFLAVAIIMTALIFIFSKFYLHREQGFKRFYSTVLLFFTGLSLIILAGNFEVLFVGWELIGISSVLLVAFYRDRFLPARNALKIFSVYRIADAFLLAAIWYAHHIFEKSVNFSELSELTTLQGDIAILGILLLMVAMIKSAQFPFSYWLPRAMEGPTTSSAIFYGALSVHMGLFLLLRTFPIWEDNVAVRVAIAVLGLVTAIVASSIARVQSSIKTQIAYASITQIGIMFIEVAAGLHWLALFHFVSNASLRTYQLLISPSVVSYLVHDQFFNFVPPLQKIKNTFLGRLRATFYVLGVKEWNMNATVSLYVWKPLKRVGRMFAFLDKPVAQIALLAALLSTLFVAVSGALPSGVSLVTATIAAIMSIVLYTRAYTTKGVASVCWNLIMLGNVSSILFLITAADGDWGHLALYGVGVVLAFAVGHVCLWYVRSRGETSTLRDYQGSIYVLPKLGNFFFVVVLLLMAFPISSSFLAQDILLNSIHGEYAYLIGLFGVSYLMVGVSTIRLYTKVFFGPHKTNHHEIAYRSS